MDDEKENEKINKEIEEEAKKLLDWIYHRELTWLAFMLTCFIGLIEKLPEIKFYGSSVSGRCLSTLLTVVAMMLVFGCVFSIDRFIIWGNIELETEYELPERMRNRLHSSNESRHELLWEMDKKGKLLCLKSWLRPLIILLFIIVWIPIIILKLIVSN